jgi:hypothetical protein
MIDDTFSVQIALLATQAELNAYKITLEALDKLPLLTAKATIRDWLEGCEDKKVLLERKLEPVAPLHSEVL